MTRDEITTKIKSIIANSDAGALDEGKRMAIEDEFEMKIPEEVAERLTTIGAWVDYIVSHS